MKRIIVAGSRTFDDYELARKYIKSILASDFPNGTIIIISGGCRGADLLGERFSTEYGMDLGEPFFFSALGNEFSDLYLVHTGPPFVVSIAFYGLVVYKPVVEWGENNRRWNLSH